MKLKKTTLIAFFLMAVICTYAQSVVTIQITLNGIPDSTVVNLVAAATHKNFKPVASAKLIASKAIFTVETTAPKLFYLQLDKTYGSYFVMIDKGENIQLTADVLTENRGAYSLKLFRNVKIKGASLQSVFEHKMAPRYRLDSLHEAIENKYKDYTTKWANANSEQDTAEIKRLNQTVEAKAYSEETQKLFSGMNDMLKKIADDNKDSFWAPLLLFQSLGYFTPEQKPLYESLSQAAKDSEYGREMKEELYPAGMVGQVAPSFKVINDNGKKEDASDYTKGAKYILVDFWASWCNPCRMEIPNFKNLYTLYKDKGFQIISISADKTEEAWEKALLEEKLTWPNFRDSDNSITELFKVRFYPTIYLIDNTGKIIAENIRGEALATKLAELFN